VANGVVYIGFGPNMCGLDAKTGARLWYTFDPPTQGVVSSLAVADGVVYGSSWDGGVYAWGLK
jgi:outer membrane protein assembly factor BamB